MLNEIQKKPQKETLPDENDTGDIAEEFHRGGGLEGYGHKITTEKEQKKPISDLEG